MRFNNLKGYLPVKGYWYIHELCLHIPVHNGEKDDTTQDD